MILSRVDLCDLRTPESMAKGVLAQLPELTAPVRVSDVARSLGISDVRVDSFDGFEGMLLTDTVRSVGAILANKSHGEQRARFTIAHELGHFLMKWHKLSATDGFQCRSIDMQETREDRLDRKQETQANRFAIELLAPRSLVDPFLSSNPELRDAQKMRDALHISLEAAVRRMVERRDEALALVVSKDGRGRYTIRSRDFPWLHLKKDDFLPRGSAAQRAVSNGTPGFTELMETSAPAWTDRSDVELWEQTRVGKNNKAITLLEADIAGGDDAVDEVLTELREPGFR